MAGDRTESDPPPNGRPHSGVGDEARPSGRATATLGLLGPAFVAAVAYVDPGNVAANLQGGARFGYLLVWVLVMATIAAGLVQFLSARLGVVTGASLPELVGARLRTPGRLAFWLQAEAVAMATDLAEVVGGAVALQLLFDLPLLLGGVIAGAVSLGMLAVQNYRGQRAFERVITAFLLIIAIGFIAGLFVEPPDPAAAVAGLVPRFAGPDSVLLATAMLGATIMPHVVYLHSALARDRYGSTEPGPRRRQLLRATRIDVTAAMVVAGGVNVAMLLLAASALAGRPGVDTLAGAHAAVTASLGQVVGVLFAVGLLASGLASTSVGCYAGSEILAGLLRVRVPLLLRRVITLIPALVVLAVDVEPTSVLVISQVVLSFGLPFVLVPLVRLSTDRDLMGADAAGRGTAAMAWLITAAITVLNAYLIVLAF